MMGRGGRGGGWEANIHPRKCMYQGVSKISIRLAKENYS